MSQPTFLSLLGTSKSILFPGRGSEFTRVYYALKREQLDTDFLLNIPPNDFYPDSLAEKRASYIATAQRQNYQDCLQVLLEDRRNCEEKSRRFKMRYLFPRLEVEGYANGSYGAFLMGPIPPQMRQEHLRRLANALSSNPNVLVGLTEEPIDIYFAVSDVGVIFGLRGDKRVSLLAVASGEPGIVSAFKEYFEDIWKSSTTDRGKVVSYISSVVTNGVK